MVTKKTVEINGLSVFYRDQGEGETIFILHGWRASSDSWIQVQENLAHEGFRVIVPDLPGFGDTPAPEEPWSVEDYTFFIRSLLETLDISPQAIVGHSFGGRIAVFYATKYGYDLSDLVLCNAPGFFRYPKIRVFVYDLFTSFYDLVMQAPLLKSARPMVRKVFHIVTRSKGRYHSTNRTMRKTFKSVVEEPMRPYLTDITTPTLILCGEKDHQVPISDARIIHEEIPESRLVMLPKVGHNIHSRMPEEVAQRISLFLKENSTKMVT